MPNDKSRLPRRLNSSLNKTEINRLQRIYRRRQGSCARLASQKNMLAPHSAHQNRLFVNALLESFSFHLLTGQTPLKTDLPDLSPSGRSLANLLAAISRQEFTEEDFTAEAEAQLEYSEEESLFRRRCEIETSKNQTRSFLGAAAALGLKSHERVNFLCLRPAEETPSSRSAEKLLLELPSLTRIRQKRELAQEKGREAFRQLEDYLRNLAACDNSAVRISADSRYVRELAALGAAGPLPSLPLPPRSRIFIHYKEAAPPEYDERLKLKLALSGIFRLSPDKIHDVWTGERLGCALISCAAGYFHLPVTVRVSAEGRWYNPCVFTRPVLAKQTAIKVDSRLICPCGIQAPIVKYCGFI